MRLFKYCDENGIDILKNNRLLITQACELNDPFEFLGVPDTEISAEKIAAELRFKSVQDHLYNRLYDDGHITFPRHQFSKWLKLNKPSVIEGLLSNYEEGIHKGFKNLYEWQSRVTGVVSLTRRPNSFLHWSHYTNKHRGFVIEFNLESYPFNFEAANRLDFGPVEYAKDLIKIPASISLESDEYDQTFRKMTLTKHFDWKYEKEYRYLFLIKRTDDAAQVPIGKYFIPLPPTAIKQIVLGSRVALATQKDFESILSRQEFNHIILKKANINQTQYKLNYSQIHIAPVIPA